MRFFFHDVSTQRETVEESAARFLPQGSASWRLSHLPLFKRHPDAGNTQKLILVCLQKQECKSFDEMEGKRLVNMKYCEYEVVLKNSDLL